jgi:hypothetical protein
MYFFSSTDEVPEAVIKSMFQIHLPYLEAIHTRAMPSLILEVKIKN